MKDDNTNAPIAYAAAIAAGAVLWIAFSMAGNRSEAWDSPLYWVLAYPLAIVVAGVLGYWAPQRAWRWGLAVMWSQGIMAVLGGASLNLFPLALIMLTLLSLPPIGAALLGRWLRLKRGDDA